MTNQVILCLNKPDADQTECRAEEYERQKALLNVEYKLVWDKANRAERAALDNAQKAWVSFRNLDCATRTTSFLTSHAQYWNFACLTDRTLERRTHLQDYFQR